MSEHVHDGGRRPGEAQASALARQIDDASATRGGHLYLEEASSDRGLTYAGLRSACARCIRWVVTAGFSSPGADRPFALVVGDPLLFAVAYLGLLAGGYDVAPCDANAPADDLAGQLAVIGAGAVVTDQQLKALSAPIPVLRIDQELPGDTEQLDGEGSLVDAAGDVVSEGTVLLFSSGSTGPRKGVRLSSSQLLYTAGKVAEQLQLSPEDRGYSPLPLFHVNAEVVGLLATLVARATLAVDRRFHRKRFWELVAERGITWINAVPAIIAILAHDLPEVRPAGVRFVRSASAPLPVSVLERFEQVTGIPVVETYGMTEAASQITANPVGGPRKPGSVGLPAGVELRVIDGTGRQLSPGQRGTVQIRGPSVVRSYLGNAGAERFDEDGWLDTGDEGHVDDDGYLYLEGRSGDAINRGGEKVFPREVEEVLRQHDAVQEAAVVGRPDPVLGEVPVAFVVPYPSYSGDLISELAELSRARLSRFKQPVGIYLVPQLPLGPTGKVSHQLVAASMDKLLDRSGRHRDQPAP